MVKRIGEHLGLSAESMCSLDDLICSWLREADNVHEESGTPSWETLAKALEQNDCEDIARQGIVLCISLAANEL